MHEIKSICDASVVGGGWDIVRRKNNFLFGDAAGISTNLNIALRLFIEAALTSELFLDRI